LQNENIIIGWIIPINNLRGKVEWNGQKKKSCKNFR
jgi:hypothetical protein